MAVFAGLMTTQARVFPSLFGTITIGDTQSVCLLSRIFKIMSSP